MVTSEPRAPKAFITYSRDDDPHIAWVEAFAAQLVKDGVDMTLDAWHLELGDELTEFMERAIRESDFVIAVCTPRFKEKTNERKGGVGYEARLLTVLALARDVDKPVIPVVRQGNDKESVPDWLRGSLWIDLTGDPYSESNYNLLLRKLHDAWKKPPKLGPRPHFDGEEGPDPSPNPTPAKPARQSTPKPP